MLALRTRLLFTCPDRCFEVVQLVKAILVITNRGFWRVQDSFGGLAIEGNHHFPRSKVWSMAVCGPQRAFSVCARVLNPQCTCGPCEFGPLNIHSCGIRCVRVKSAGAARLARPRKRHPAMGSQGQARPAQLSGTAWMPCESCWNAITSWRAPIAGAGPGAPPPPPPPPPLSIPSFFQPIPLMYLVSMKYMTIADSLMSAQSCVNVLTECSACSRFSHILMYIAADMQPARSMSGPSRQHIHACVGAGTVYVCIIRSAVCMACLLRPC